MKHLAPLNKYFYRYKWQFIIGIICTVIANYIAILSPQITGFIINKLTFKDVSNAEYNNYNFIVKKIVGYMLNDMQGIRGVILSATIVLLVLAILRGLFMFMMRQTIIVGSRQVEYDLKNDIYAQYQQLDLSFYKKNFVGDMMNRISEDVSKVRMYAGPALMYIVNMLVLLVLSVYFMFDTNVVLAIITLSPLPLLAFIIYKISSKIQQGTTLAQQELSALTVQATETYSGIKVVQAFAYEKNMFSKFSATAKTYQDKMLRLAKLEAFYSPAMIFLISVSTLLTIAVGGIMVVQKTISVAVIVEFVMYINMLIFPVSSIGFIASIIQSAIASQKRITEFMAISPVVNKKNDAAIVPLITGRIQFHDVDFIYEHTKIHAIKQLNFYIEQGKKIAFMGRMASGKSTLGQLLVRNFDISNGKITIDNNDIRDIDLKHLRQHIAYIAQDNFIFSDTIKNNLLIHQQQTIQEDQLIAITKTVQLYDEIMQMPDQWNTVLGERGINLSGGQKQRLAIARALMTDKSIYIFDDSFSAIDLITERKIIQALNVLLANKTLIFITHRVYDNLHFDTIYVMENGSIVEHGTHENLLQQHTIYYDLYQQQFKPQVE